MNRLGGFRRYKFLFFFDIVPCTIAVIRLFPFLLNDFNLLFFFYDNRLNFFDLLFSLDLLGLLLDFFHFLGFRFNDFRLVVFLALFRLNRGHLLFWCFFLFFLFLGLILFGLGLRLLDFIIAHGAENAYQSCQSENADPERRRLEHIRVTTIHYFKYL